MLDYTIVRAHQHSAGKKSRQSDVTKVADVFSTKVSKINMGNDILKLFKGASSCDENNELISS